MPIRVLDKLPAVNFLRNENIFVMTKSNNNIKNIRPLKVIILNLMPKKIETENQFLRLLSNSPLQIDIQLLRIDDHIKDKNFDGLVVTGAPLGLINFSDVVFWPQIKLLLNWIKEHVTTTLFICWSAQAALNILYGIPKITRKKKLVGVYKHKTLKPYSLLTRGFDEIFLAPHSRNVDFPQEHICQNTDLEILAASDEIGAYLFASQDKRLVFVTGHPEYDVLTLAREYKRDLKLGLNPDFPVNYFPENNPSLIPRVNWRSHSHLLFANWLNYYVY